MTATFQDPITFEVFKNAVVSLADEMGLVTLRTSHSANIKISMDFSTAITDHEGRVLGQGNGMLLHLGSVPDALRLLLRKYEGRIYPGDVYILNNSDEAMQHLPDLYVLMPCYERDQLIGFAVCTSHMTDVGGRVRGSMSTSSREIFEEGLQIPLLKLYDGGVVNETLVEMLRRNVRLPDLVLGDIEGQMAACRAGERGLVQLTDRYTLPGLRHLGDELFAYTERVTRAAIHAIPDGTYEFEDWLDDDGVGGPPVRIKVTVHVSGDRIAVDWTGSSDQVPSAINLHMTNTRSATYGALLGALGRDIPSNDGFYRCVDVTAPEGSVMNPRRPAAMAARFLTAARMMDALLGALAQALPDRVPAANDGGPDLVSFSGARGGAPFVVGMGSWGSWGGRPGLDGIDGISPLGANVAPSPIEVVEREGVFRVEQVAFVPDTGGAGRWRGGLGIVADYRVLVDEAEVQLRSSRREVRPYGLDGGAAGAPSANVLNPGTHERELPVCDRPTVRRGDVVRHVTAGGGGYGDPMARSPEAVLDDVVGGKMTLDHAKRQYGVVIDPVAHSIDETRTAEIRNQALG